MYKKLVYACCFVLVLGLVSSTNASTVLVGGDTLNGNFNGLISPSTVDGQPFSNVVAWENIGTGDQGTQCTRTNLAFDGTRTAVLAGGDVRDYALDTGHMISAGEDFDISYVWRDASSWADGSDQVRVTLFVTDDNTINGTRTNLVQDLSGLSTQNSTYEAVDHDTIYIAVPANSGKTLFVVIDTTATGTAFARLDNFTLEMGTTYAASGPNPKNNAVDVLIDADLSWTPGALAAAHDVYLGTVFDDVNSADITTPLGVLVSPAQDANTFVPESFFELGQTYYWRIDEVNDLEPDSPWKGHVWSFTVEPVAYPIEDVNATASNSNRADEGPENTINASGVDANDLHSSENTDMWLSSAADPNAAWIQYEFDRIHKLYQMWVWNYNSSVELVVGFGIKEATIEYSVDGTNWAILGTTHEFAQGPGAAGYAPNTTVDLSGVAAKYVRLTANSNWGGIFSQYGLSEVRFFYIPVFAREPSPDSGATDVDVDVTFGFRAGREAAKHDVYLSIDEQAVIDGNAPVTTVTEASYGPLSLDLGTTYYWKINEVNEAEAPTIWQGDIWDFTTHEYFVVDDFEDYNDYPPDEIWATWVDGYGVPENGATVGYPAPNFFAGEHYMETTIVYGGEQAMPLFYDNTVATYSEATVNVANLQVGQDWTKHGIKALTLRFYGDPNNAVEQMYVKLNGSKVTYDGDAENLKRIGWQMWYIDLASLGVSLSNVTELSIGFERIGAVGGQGVVYFDGIRLYSYDRQVITPAEAGTTGLQAHYEFEGNTNDSSGNGRHGTAVGGPAFVVGKVGQAISLDGIDDYVEITGYKGVVGDGSETPPWTVTAWVRTNGNGEVVGWGSTGDGNRMEFRINAGRTRAEGGGGNTQGDTSINDGGWHHIAVTVQPNSVYSSGIDLWSEGQLDTRSNTDPDPWHPTANFDVKIGIRYNGSGRQFTGTIDDVRIYNRVLTEEEVAWLAGRTLPFDKPF